MSRLTTITRRAAIGCLPLLSFLATSPKPRAHAQFDVFTALTSTVNGIGSSITGVNTSVGQMRSLEQEITHPQGDLSMIENNGNGFINSYRDWMSSVFRINLSSAATPTAQALENQLFSGLVGGTPTSPVGSLYRSTYGSLPTSTQAPLQIQQSVDAGDASAASAMQMSAMADASANASEGVAHSIETQAVSTSSGSGAQADATARAYEIQSMAVEHKLLAAQLRLKAAQLGQEGTKRKVAATVNGNAVGAVFGGIK